MSTHNHTRRIFLHGLLAAGCVQCLPRFGFAETGKMNKTQAKYQDKPKGDQQCSNCMYFIAPSACLVVDGNISPDAWCSLWIKKPAEEPIGKI
ncbi:hypothetical protein [Methylomonas albis]|uniref:High potential iron-sulfur proteins family profile domain-containing protein n=1 Tax=Methylomonas albis TaxID=1854563 RepID=A0ABR9D133_9GAMM|nr:hypothetical protein [Methylomonas albis]MBD9356511.1 hypothetical protein [Methylomonas albis]